MPGQIYVRPTTTGPRAVQPPCRRRARRQLAVYTFNYEGIEPGHELTETVVFEDIEGKTRITTTAVYQSIEDRVGMLSSGMEWGARDIAAMASRSPRIHGSEKLLVRHGPRFAVIVRRYQNHESHRRVSFIQ